MAMFAAGVNLALRRKRRHKLPRERSDRVKHRLTIAWAILACFVIAMQTWENAQRRTARAEYQRRLLKQVQFDNQIATNLTQIHDNLKRKLDTRPPTFDEFSRAVGHGFMKARAYGIGGEEFFYTDSLNGGRAQVIVVDGYVKSIAPSPYPRKVSQPPTSQIASIVRRLSYLVGYVVWIVLLILYVGERNPVSRHLQAHAMLLLAVGSTALSFLGPQGFRTWANLLEDDSPAWGYLMIPISLALLIHTTRAARSPSYPACATCGYNLTGNISGVCPECGNPIPPRAEEARASA
jgi:predicted RNA-binding Zn-ribbon protein involved in translation (DUF1610 family)